MTQRQIQIVYLVKKLKYKYEQNNDCDSLVALNRILLHSYPVVYCDSVFDDGDYCAIWHAIELRKQKKKRVNRYLRDMTDFYDELSFVTLTFDDEHLSSLNELTRKRYAQRWLNENCRDYIANVDYGKKNGREHFHAVVALKDTTEQWKCGYMSLKRLNFGVNTKDRYRVSSYLLKLTNHATKLGTGKSFRKKQREDIDKLPF